MHVISSYSSVQDNSISIDGAICPKPIVTEALEFTYSITPRSHASRTPFLSMFSVYLSHIHHLFWTRLIYNIEISRPPQERSGEEGPAALSC